MLRDGGLRFPVKHDELVQARASRLVSSFSMPALALHGASCLKRTAAVILAFVLCTYERREDGEVGWQLDNGRYSFVAGAVADSL